MQIEAVKTYLLALQQTICSTLAAEDGAADFIVDEWQREEGGGGRSRVLSEGAVFEKAGVNFSHVRGANLPASASAARPELAGRSSGYGGVAGDSSTQSLRAHLPCQCATVCRRKAR